MTDEDRRILREARRLLENAPEAYEPPTYLASMRCRTYDPGPAEPLEPEQRKPLDTKGGATIVASPDMWAGWESWLQARLDTALAAERKTLLRAVAKVVGQSLGETISEELAREREQWEAKMSELRRECAKLSSALESLHEMTRAERSKTLDLPALPRRGDLN